MIGNEKAFTIVELMVVLLLAAVMTAVIYKTFPAQQKAAISQQQVTEMQQQIRAAMSIMGREIKMAGYNPLRVSCPASVSSGCCSWILTAKVNEIKFTMDVTGGENDGLDNDGDGNTDESDEKAYPDGDCNDANETITYSLYTSPSGKPTLGRKASVSAATQSIAENIEAIGFAYAFDNNGDGQLDKDPTGSGVVWAIDTNADGLLDLNLDTNHDGEVNENDTPSGQALNPTIPIGKIRAVKIWLLARTEQPDSDFKNSNTYAVANQRITVNDGYRRRLLTSTEHCWNMGL